MAETNIVLKLLTIQRFPYCGWQLGKPLLVIKATYDWPEFVGLGRSDLFFSPGTGPDIPISNQHHLK
jgi:hypothetical protein